MPQVWEKTSDGLTVAVAHLRLVIKDFSFMSLSEVDPVNYATIIGAAGGAWRKCLPRDFECHATAGLENGPCT